MLKVWIVEVETIGRGKGTPMHEYFAVAVDTAPEAQEAVRDFVKATDQLVVTRARLRPGVAEELGIRSGRVLRLTGRKESS